ncbi:MAG: 4a-hydroxytetrahydrobiopterin dehydratase [Chloroflexi bacterium]|nr:4a-hydroxytetrahydrobiopterin dehydratase [Chloroflexota bacterium]
MAESLTARQCAPCEGGVPALTPEEISLLLLQVRGWRVIDGKKLTKTYTFSDFAKALAFVNRAGTVAEAEGHHPDLLLSWGRVVAEVWTHAIGGLSENDFILAAKLDQVWPAPR